ncbi:MAG: hypothetical protein AB1611_18315 [bacterium]
MEKAVFTYCQESDISSCLFKFQNSSSYQNAYRFPRNCTLDGQIHRELSAKLPVLSGWR